MLNKSNFNFYGRYLIPIASYATIESLEYQLLINVYLIYIIPFLPLILTVLSMLNKLKKLFKTYPLIRFEHIRCRISLSIFKNPIVNRILVSTVLIKGMIS